jgi:hypothetical protein
MLYTFDQALSMLALLNRRPALLRNRALAPSTRPLANSFNLERSRPDGRNSPHGAGE